MGASVKAIGHGLLAAGFVLTAIYLVGTYLKGSEALGDALNPLALTNYLALAPLAPSALLLWLSDYMSRRQSRHG